MVGVSRGETPDREDTIMWTRHNETSTHDTSCEYDQCGDSILIGEPIVVERARYGFGVAATREFCSERCADRFTDDEVAAQYG